MLDKIPTGLLCALLVVLYPSLSRAGNYQFVDQEGVTHYTNAPTDPAYRRFFVKAPPPHESRPSAPGGYSAEVRQAADRYGVDARLVGALIQVESAGNPLAVSSKGAQGLMQIMPTTASLLGVRDVFSPPQNIDGGVRHLRALLDSFGDLSLALAAYNAGAEAVRSYRGIPPFPETRDYVRKILRLYSGDGPVAQPGSLRPSPPAPQRVYRLQEEDGTITFTNLPPRLNSTR